MVEAVGRARRRWRLNLRDINRMLSGTQDMGGMPTVHLRDAAAHRAGVTFCDRSGGRVPELSSHAQTEAGLGRTKRLPSVTVKGQESGQCCVLLNLCIPAIRRCNGVVECGVGICEPPRTGVVEVGQCARLQLLSRRFVAGDRALRVAWYRFVGPFHPFGRVEPAVAQLH